MTKIIYIDKDDSQCFSHYYIPFINRGKMHKTTNKSRGNIFSQNLSAKNILMRRNWCF